jgi:hypothetical protein
LFSFYIFLQVGIFALKQHPIVAPFVLPLPYLTILAHR